MKKKSPKRGARLGQHFLVSRAISARMAEIARSHRENTILEIGPGKGALTRELLACGARVIAIEKDEELVKALHTLFQKEIHDEKLRIVHADVRDITPEELGLTTYTLAANIPYYITGEIIRQFLTAHIQPNAMILLVQKEVAERIARSAKESILSLSVKAYGTPRYVKTVPAGNFSPPPSVDSAILAIENISRTFFHEVGEQEFFTIVRAGFSARRKMLAGNLASVFGRERVEKALETCGIAPRARAEDVPLEKWGSLTKTLT